MIYEKESVFDTLSYECLEVLQEALKRTYTPYDCNGFPHEVRKQILQSMRRKVIRNPADHIYQEFVEKEIAKL